MLIAGVKAQHIAQIVGLIGPTGDDGARRRLAVNEQAMGTKVVTAHGIP